MNKIVIKFFVTAFVVLIIDQLIKQIFLNGFRWNGNFFSLILVYNDGVAFSMFSFLGKYLKFMQLGLILIVCVYLFLQKKILSLNTLALGIIIGAGASNLLDRFIHVGVVDYVFWHKWFEFAVFNFADVMIDVGIAKILWNELFMKKKVSK